MTNRARVYGRNYCAGGWVFYLPLEPAPGDALSYERDSGVTQALGRVAAIHFLMIVPAKSLVWLHRMHRVHDPRTPARTKSVFFLRFRLLS